MCAARAASNDDDGGGLVPEDDEAVGASSAPAAPASAAAYEYIMRAQTIDGRGNYQIVATDDDTVWDLKCKVAAKMEGPDATKLRIICSGKELDDDRKYLKDWNIGKNSTVCVLIKGRNTVPAPASDEVPACSSPADLLKGMGGRPRSAVTAADVRWPRRVAQPGAWGCDVAPT